MERFYLGAHRTYWLTEVWDVPLMLSYRQLRGGVRGDALVPRGSVDTTFAIDSGGFTELSRYGEWRASASAYAMTVLDWSAVRGFQWATIQDWMCEPNIRAKTGLSVHEHQLRTIASYLHLMSRYPEIHWLPVLQGWQVDDYLRHVDMYLAAGVELRSLPLVGLGSVCRRQATDEIGAIAQRLALGGLRLHGFGVKVAGVARYGRYLVSSDSKAWSVAAMHDDGPCSCAARHAHKTNCLAYALDWYERQIVRRGEEKP